jgi:hypothetical protein
MSITHPKIGSKPPRPWRSLPSARAKRMKPRLRVSPPKVQGLTCICTAIRKADPGKLTLTYKAQTDSAETKLHKMAVEAATASGESYEQEMARILATPRANSSDAVTRRGREMSNDIGIGVGLGTSVTAMAPKAERAGGAIPRPAPTGGGSSRSGSRGGARPATSPASLIGTAGAPVDAAPGATSARQWPVVSYASASSIAAAKGPPKGWCRTLALVRLWILTA